MSDKEEHTNNENTSGAPIRDHLVNTAVNFLLNPDVIRRQDDGKASFLKKKGLTDAEISEAFERVKLKSKGVNNALVSSEYNRFSPPVPQHYYHQVPYSFWSRLSQLSSSLIVFGVAIYGIHHLYKKFIRPWLLGEETEVEFQLKHMKELTKNLAMLTETVEKLHATVMEQDEKIEKLLKYESCGYAPTPVVLQELTKDVSSLKSILISRHQFPAAPQVQVVKATIPSWQLPLSQSTDENTSEQQNLADCEAFESVSSICNEAFVATDAASDSLLPRSAVEPKHAIANESNGLAEDTGESEA